MSGRPDHIISFGRGTIALRKRPGEFRLVRPSAEAVDLLRQHDGVSSVARRGIGTWSVRVGNEARLDPIMAAARRWTVAHHAYAVDGAHDDASFVPTDVVNLKFVEGAGARDRDELTARHALAPWRELGHGWRAYRVTSRTRVNPMKLCEQLAGDQRIAAIEPDFIVPNARFSSGDLVDEQWHLHGRAVAGLAHANVRDAWRTTVGEPDIVIAVIDDGFDMTNPDLQGNVVHPSDFTSIALAGMEPDQLAPDDGDPSPERLRGDFHGTACAGLAIARNRVHVAGVAPGCAFMPVRCDICGVSQDMLLGVFSYVSKRADVVSCSWGTPPSGYVNMSRAASDVLGEIMRSGGRRGRGLVICFAAGNQDLPTSLPAAENTRGLEFYDPTSGTVLGRFFKGKDIHGGWTEIEGIIVVGSMTSRSRKALYSNWGRTLSVVGPSDNWHPRSIRTRSHYESMDLLTTDNDSAGLGLREVGLSDRDDGFVTRGMGGTSGATPIVAGVCGLVLSANPDLHASEVKEIIERTADRASLDTALDEPDMFNNMGQTGAFDPATGHSLWFGFGKVDAAAAVAEAKRRKGG